METKETEQGRQYKEYTREATGSRKKRSATRWRVLVRIAQFHNPFGRQPWCCLFFCLFLPVYFLEA